MMWKKIIVLVVVLSFFCFVGIQFSLEEEDDKLQEHRPAPPACESNTQNVERERYQHHLENGEAIKMLSAKGRANYSIYLSYIGDETPVLQDTTRMRSASMIKVFLLADVMEKIKMGKLNLNDEYILQNKDKVGGAGILSGYPDGVIISLEKLLELMITESDNTATNIIIDMIGVEDVNRYLVMNGFKDTQLKRKMMDMTAIREGRENYTSASDLGTFFLRLYHSKIVGGEYDAKMREILFNQTDEECFVRALPYARIAHKTGELDHFYADGGIIYGAGEHDMILVILAEDIQDRAQTLDNMREIARLAIRGSM